MKHYFACDRVRFNAFMDEAYADYCEQMRASNEEPAHYDDFVHDVLVQLANDHLDGVVSVKLRRDGSVA